MNKKAWVYVGSPRFFYLQPIQYIGLMDSGPRALISPTKLELLMAMKIYDILNPSFQGIAGGITAIYQHS
jgi:hypothetical protein